MTPRTDDRRWRLRRATGADVEALQRFVAALSLHSRVQRFFTPFRELPAPTVDALRRGSADHGFVLAEADDGSVAAFGECAFDAVERGSCELALVVADAWQGQGLGRALLERLLDDAARAGPREARLEILAGNRRMQRLAMRCGFALFLQRGDAERVIATRTIAACGAARRGSIAAWPAARPISTA